MTNWTSLSLKTERLLRAGVRASLTDWAILALAAQGQTPARHHRLMIGELERVASGTCDRLMLLLPPGSAKSTYASLLFPAWFLGQYPESHLICVSHTAGLATEFGRGVRGLIGEHGARLGIGVDPSEPCGVSIWDDGGRDVLCDGGTRAGDRAPGRPVSDRRSGEGACGGG